MSVAALQEINRLLEAGEIDRTFALKMKQKVWRCLLAENEQLIAKMKSIRSSFTSQNMREWAHRATYSAPTGLLNFKFPTGFNRHCRATRPARLSSASASASGNGDPDPDPERPYIALGIDHKATTPAGPPVLAVLRPFTDLNTLTARPCQYEQPKHPEPQGSNPSPPRG